MQKAIICAGLLTALVSLPVDAAFLSEGGESLGHIEATKDRLSTARMEELVARPMSLVEAKGLAAGQQAFEQDVSTARQRYGERSVEVADLLTSFGVNLYILGLDRDDLQLKQASLAYLEAAIPAYRASFGAAHPEVAVALNSYADVEIALQKDDPPANAEAALEEAYRIRVAALGPDHAETRSSLFSLAELKGDPARTQGDAKRIAAAAELFVQLISITPNQPELGMESAPLRRFALAQMYAENGMGNEAADEARLALQQMEAWPPSDRCFIANFEILRLAGALAENGNDELARTMTDGKEFERMIACANQDDA